MRFALPSSLAAAVALTALAGACSSGTDDSRMTEGDDSTALAVAASEAVAATLAGTSLGTDLSQGGLIIEPAGSAWDSVFATELRTRAPATGAVRDSARLLALSTHGFDLRGDTATVAVVLRSCITGDMSFNFSQDSLVHRLVRSDTAASGWSLAGPVMRDHAIGTCKSADSLTSP